MFFFLCNSFAKQFSFRSTFGRLTTEMRAKAYHVSMLSVRYFLVLFYTKIRMRTRILRKLFNIAEFGLCLVSTTDGRTQIWRRFKRKFETSNSKKKRERGGETVIVGSYARTGGTKTPLRLIICIRSTEVLMKDKPTDCTARFKGHG